MSIIHSLDGNNGFYNRDDNTYGDCHPMGRICLAYAYIYIYAHKYILL